MANRSLKSCIRRDTMCWSKSAPEKLRWAGRSELPQARRDYARCLLIIPTHCVPTKGSQNASQKIPEE